MEAFLETRPARTMLSFAECASPAPSTPAATPAGRARREDDAEVATEADVSDLSRASPLLGGLALDLPEVLELEVLARLDAHDRAMFARTCRGARAAVLASGLPRAGALHENPPLHASRAVDTLAMTRWALDNGLPSHWRVAEHAAAAGNLPALRLLRDRACPWNWRACAAAAQGGHLDVLRWAVDNGCAFPWDVVCAFAALGGHVDVLRWARDRGCPWDEETCASAAEGGHLHLLRWARAMGCPWDRETVVMAEKNGHARVAAWARDNGCPE